jgi:hypothetical protein
MRRRQPRPEDPSRCARGPACSFRCCSSACSPPCPPPAGRSSRGRRAAPPASGSGATCCRSAHDPGACRGGAGTRARRRSALRPGLRSGVGWAALRLRHLPPRRLRGDGSGTRTPRRRRRCPPVRSAPRRPPWRCSSLSPPAPTSGRAPSARTASSRWAGTRRPSARIRGLSPGMRRRVQSASGGITFVRFPSTSTSRIVSAPLRRMSSQASGVWKAMWGVTTSRPRSQPSPAR